MKKKLLALLLALVMLFALASCSSGSTTASNTNETSPAEETEEVVDEVEEEQADAEEVEEQASAATPELTVTSDIFGTADTGNNSTLKAWLAHGGTYYDENGNRAEYPKDVQTECEPVQYTGEALLDLGDDVDDSLIDSSNAVVQIVPGDGYYVDELILNATTLDGAWENGKYHYTLDEEDIQWYTDGYVITDANSGREWSCFGGDGNGCYTFTLEVSGITYDGQEVEAATFPVQVYIWGRNATDKGVEFDAVEDPVAVESTSGVTPTDEVQWTWVGDGEKPILCDSLSDDFFITWPEGTDASGVTADDVTITLYSQYGDSYQLVNDDYADRYAVFASETETQVAVTYMQWAYVPVYTTMTIEVNSGDLSASNTYDVASVYIYEVQQGGGGTTVDGSVTVFSFYGFENLTDADQVVIPVTYTLTVGEDEDIQYYAEDESGNGYLTSDKEEAVYFDASGEEDNNIQLIGQTLYTTFRRDQTEDKTVDGETVTFNKLYLMDELETHQFERGNVMKYASEMAEAGLVAAPGFVLGDSITPYEMWAWGTRFQAGFMPEEPAPTSFPYTTFPYGY